MSITEKIDILMNSQKFRVWQTCCIDGLNILEKIEWLKKEGYKEGCYYPSKMVEKRWEKYWTRHAQLITGAIPGETISIATQDK